METKRRGSQPYQPKEDVQFKRAAAPTRHLKRNISKTVVDAGLCIGCGFCFAFCPGNAITMSFDKYRRYIPVVDKEICNGCGLCIDVCPNSPLTLTEDARRASAEGPAFGLSNSLGSFLCYDLDDEKRLRSASGGVVTAFLSRLLECKEVEGVIAAGSRSVRFGEKFHEVSIFKSVEELEDSRSSKYYPLTYADALKTVMSSQGRYAVVGLPCVMRAIWKMPRGVRQRIKFTVSLFCSRNVTGQFVEYLARREKITADENFMVNLRDKAGISSAIDFNSCFVTAERTIRRRQKEYFGETWTNYCFAHEACLFCPDAYGADAGLSAKDAWGSGCVSDPRGCSYAVVRDPKTLGILEDLKRAGRIYLEPVGTEELRKSQKNVVLFKHAGAIKRFAFKAVLRRELKGMDRQDIPKASPGLRPALGHFMKLATLRLSRWQFFLMPNLSLRWLILANNLLRRALGLRKI